MGRQAGHSRYPSALPGTEALPNRAGVRRWRQRLAILSLRVDSDETLPRERCQRLLLLEYFSERRGRQPLGMGAELSFERRHDIGDVQVQQRILSYQTYEPFC